MENSGAGGESVHLKAFSRTLSRALRVSTYSLLSCLFFERLINFLFRSSIFFIDHDRASIVVPSLLLGGLPDEQLPWLCVTFCFVVCCTCLDTKWQKEKQKRSSIYYLSLHRRLVSRSCRARVVLGESIVFRDVDQQQRWK